MNEKHYSLYGEQEPLAQVSQVPSSDKDTEIDALNQFGEPVITRRRPPLPRIQTSFATVYQADAVSRHEPQCMEEQYHGLPQVRESIICADPYSEESLYFDSLTSTPVNNASQWEGMDVDSLFGSIDTDVKGQSDGESYYAESEESGSEDQSDDDDDDYSDDEALSHAYTQFLLPTWKVCVPSTPPPSPQTLLQGQGQSGPPLLPPSIIIITPPPPTASHLARESTRTPDIPYSPEITNPPRTPETTNSPSSPDLTATTSTTTTRTSTTTTTSNTLDDEPLRCRLRFHNGLRCNATFTTGFYLARHKRAIHPSRKWAKTCIFCSYKLCFTERDAYVRHLDRVHGMRSV